LKTSSLTSARKASFSWSFPKSLSRYIRHPMSARWEA
jgi:hypothetical protein